MTSNISRSAPASPVAPSPRSVPLPSPQALQPAIVLQSTPESDGDICCQQLLSSGIVDTDYRAIPRLGTFLPRPELDTITQMRDILERPCILHGESNGIAIGHMTGPFTLRDMFTDICSNFPINDIQVIGSYVWRLIKSIVPKIPGLMAHWNPTFESQLLRNGWDIDLRLIIHNGNEQTLYDIYNRILLFLAYQIHDPALSLEEKIALIDKYFLIKMNIHTETNSNGEIINQYLTVSIAPQGQKPIDILFVNVLARPYLWEQTAPRLSFMPLLWQLMVPTQFPKRDEELLGTCHLVPINSDDPFEFIQAAVDWVGQIIRVNNRKGLDPFSVFPLLLSAYIKGGRIVESTEDLEQYLYAELNKACCIFAPDQNSINTWTGKILIRADVVKSPYRHVYVLAKGITRAINSHHQRKGNALVAMILSACNILLKAKKEEEALTLWKEVSKIRKMEEEKAGASISSPEGLYGVIKKMLDEDPKLLTAILPWMEIRAFHGLFRESMETNQKSILVRHKRGQVIRFKCEDHYFLFSIDPQATIASYARAWNGFEEAQKKKFQGFCEQYGALGEPDMERSFKLPLDPEQYSTICGLNPPVARNILSMYQMQKIYPSSTWFEDNWDKLLLAYEGVQERINLLKHFQGKYTKPETVHLIGQLIWALTNPQGKSTSIFSLRATSLFREQTDAKAVSDFESWKGVRQQLEPYERKSIDKACFDRLRIFRHDLAAEMLAYIIGDTIPYKDMEPFLNSVFTTAISVAEPKRSWSRLKTLLAVLVAQKEASPQFKLSKSVDQLLVKLLEIMYQNKAADKEFFGRVLRLVDSKNISLDLCLRFMHHYMEKNDYASAIEIWKSCEKTKIWPTTFEEDHAQVIVQLTLNTEFSLELESLYRRFQRVPSGSYFQGLQALVSTYLDNIESYEGEWGAIHVKIFLQLLKAPVISDNLKRDLKKNRFDSIYARVAPHSMRSMPLTSKDEIDHVEAMICVGVVRANPTEANPLKVFDYAAKIVVMLYQHNFIQQAAEFFHCAQQYKKVFTNKDVDTKMLSTVIRESRDFIAFAQYKNFLESLGTEAFAQLEAQAIQWIESANKDEWEVIGPTATSNGDGSDQVSRNLWLYLFKLVQQEGKFSLERANILRRIIANLKKPNDICAQIKKLCEVHAEASSEIMLPVLQDYLAIVLSPAANTSKDALENIWELRLTMQERMGITYGDAKEWEQFDTRLAVLSSDFSDNKHRKMILPLLIRMHPTPATTRLLQLEMESPSEEVRLQLLKYLAHEEGPAEDLLQNPILGKTLSGVNAAALKVLDTIYKALLQKGNRGLCIEVIRVALELADDNPKEWWNKIIVLLMNQHSIEAKLSAIVKQHYVALSFFVMEQGDCDAALYPIFRSSTSSGELIFTDEMAEKLSQVLISLISSQTVTQTKDELLLFAMPLVQADFFSSLDQDQLGLLIISMLKFCLDNNLETEASAILTLIPQAPPNQYFMDPEVEEMIRSIMEIQDDKWYMLQSLLLLHIKDIPELEYIAVAYMQRVIDAKEGRNAHMRTKLAFILAYSDYLSRVIGSEYFYVKFEEIITACTDTDLIVIVDNALIAYLRCPNFSIAIAEKLFHALAIGRNAEKQERIITHLFDYIIKNFNNVEEYEKTLFLLTVMLTSLPVQVGKRSLLFLEHPGFVETVMSRATITPTNRAVGLRTLLQIFLAFLPDNIEGPLKERWEYIHPNIYAALVMSCPMVSSEDPKVLMQHLSKHPTALYLFYMDILHICRWGSEEARAKQLMRLSSVLESVTTSEETIIMMHLPAVIGVYMSGNGKKQYLETVIQSLSKILTSQVMKTSTDIDNVLLPLDGIFTSYASNIPAKDFLAKANVWVQNCTSTFAFLITQFIKLKFENKYFEGLESNLKVYFMHLVRRQNPIPVNEFINFMPLLRDPKLIDSLNSLTNIYIKNQFPHYMRNVETKGYTEDSMVHGTFLLELVKSYANVQMSRLFRTDGPNSDGCPFEEPAMSILEILYTMTLEMTSGYKALESGKRASFQTPENLWKEYANVAKLHCQDNTEWSLVVVSHMTFVLRRIYATELYGELYEKAIKHLKEALPKIVTPRQLCLFAYVLEEFSLLEEVELTSDKSKYLALWIELMHLIFPKPVLVGAMRLRLSRMYKFMHLLQIPNISDYAQITQKVITDGTTEVMNRWSQGKLTQLLMTFDMLTPSGIRPSLLKDNLINSKLETFISDPEKFIGWWEILWANKPKTSGAAAVYYELLFKGYGALVLSTKILDFLGQEKAEVWRKIVAQILKKSAANAVFAESKVYGLIQNHQTIYRAALVDGYFDHDPDLFFELTMDVGMMIINDWERGDCEERVTWLCGDLALLTQKKLQENLVPHRKKRLNDLMNHLKAKKKNERALRVLVTLASLYPTLT